MPYVGAGVLRERGVHGQGRLQGPDGASPGCRRSATRASSEGERDGAVARIEALGLPCWVKPARLGSSVGIVRVGDAARARGARSQTAFAHDPRVIVEATAPGSRSSARCSAHRPRRRPRSPGEIVLLKGAGWYDYEAKYARGRDGARRARADLATPRASACASSRSRPSGSRAAAAWRASTSSSTATRCCSTSSTRCPGFTATSVYAKLWDAERAAVPGARRPARARSRSSAHEPRSAGTGSERAQRDLSEISRRTRISAIESRPSAAAS